MNTPTSLAQRFKKISDIAQLINSGSDLNTILERIVYAICQHSTWASCGIMGIDAKSGYAFLVQRFDPYISDEKALSDKWKLVTSPAAQVIKTGETLIIPDAQQSKDFPEYKKDAVRRNYHTVVILPLNTYDDMGRSLIMAVQSRDIVRVNKSELAFLKTVSHLATIAVEKTLRFQKEAEINARLQKAAALHTQLMEKILYKGSLAAVYKMLEKLIRHPWLVIDLTTGTVYPGRGSPLKNLSGKQWQALVQGDARRYLLDVARAAKRSQFKELVGLRFKPSENSAILKAFVEPLIVDGETIGAIILSPGKSAFDEFDRLTAEVVLLALSVQLMRGYIHFQTEATSKMDVLSHLFSGDWRSTEGFMARAMDWGIDISIPARLIVFGFLDLGNAGKGLTIGYVHRCISRAVDKLFAGAVTVNQDGEIIVLVPTNKKRDQQWENLKPRLLDDVKWMLGINPIIFRSRICKKPEDYAPVRRECGRILKLARVFKRTGLISETDFNSTAVLLSIAENRTARQFLKKSIVPLGDYDKDHGSEYLLTLKKFVEEEGRFQNCANALGIHVSTLRYRLQRISDLFGVSPWDSESRFDLLLAIKLYDLAVIDDESHQNPPSCNS